MVALSPGSIQGGIVLLGLVPASPLTFPQILGSFAYFGTLPSSRIIQTAKDLKWLDSDENGIATVSPAGARVLAINSYEQMLRQAILDYIDAESPPWVQNAPFGRARILAFVGSDVAQVFVEAKLAHGIDGDVVAFWDTLAARARGQKSCRLAAIGREGERLTIAHEEKRTGKHPKWVAIENNEDGYDVLSVISADNPRPLSIEVKTSTLGLAGFFHITRNEWARSQEMANHTFHIWAMQPGYRPALAVVSPTEMGTHIPVDAGDGCWQSAQVPFAAFRARFDSVEPHLAPPVTSPTGATR